MTSCLPNLWTSATRRWLLPAAILAIVFGFSRGAHAASLAKGTSRDAAHDRMCGCGDRCRGATCCCGSQSGGGDEAADPASGPVLPTDLANPCMSEAPCSDPGVPNTPTADPFGKSATLPLGVVRMAMANEPMLRDATLCLLPGPRADRIDDPPERLALA